MLFITVIVIFILEPINSAKGIHFRQQHSSGANTISDVEKTQETYPADKIDKLMNKTEGRFNAFLGSDIAPYITEDQVISRFQNLEVTCPKSFLCESDLNIEYPKEGETLKNTTVTIVNTENYRQGFQVEICRYPQKPCKNYTGKRKTVCIQKSYFRKVLAFDGVKEDFYRENIKVLYGCKCAELNNS